MSIDSRVTKNLDGSPKAFLFSDFFFSGPNRSPVNKNKRHCAAFIHITWRFQKNMQNGERIPFARNNRNPKFCPVRAAYRIIKRAERLHLGDDSPIAVSQSPNKRVKSFSFLTSGFIATSLKQAAKSAHKITSSEDLKKIYPPFVWSKRMCPLTPAEETAGLYQETPPLEIRYLPRLFTSY